MKIFILLSLIFLSGCSFLSKPVQITNDTIPIVAPMVQPLDIQKFTVNVINSSTINTPEWQNKPDERLFVLTENNFKIYLRNNAEFFRMIDEQNETIKFFQDFHNNKK